ncbi:synaptic vesicle 2-related protein-like [Ylistrum balloti]|uniref:synaptic vesicle 2-related protein-like n=1 Tax=Ylistrum balloti TaxID=509963 RepID=UPI002905A1AA|nr:synaptic vesicle 2-related protein-like [Ylistrum balloti]
MSSANRKNMEEYSDEICLNEKEDLIENAETKEDDICATPGVQFKDDFSDVRSDSQDNKNMLSSKTLDDVLTYIKFGRFQIKMMILTCHGYFAVCSEMMLIIFLTEPLKKEWNIANMTYPSLLVLGAVGGILGGVVTGIVSDKYGRRTPFLISTVILAVFSVLAPFVNSFSLFVCVRTLISAGEGGLGTLVHVQLLEFLPIKNRGSCLVTITLCGTLGAVYAAAMAWWLLSRYGWRIFMGACAVPTVVQIPLSFLLIKESPRFLFVSGKEESGISLLKEMARQNKKQMLEVNIDCPASTNRGRMKDLLTPALRGRTLVISAIWLLQCVGYWGVTLFLPTYMASVGMEPYLNTFSIFIGQIPGMFLAIITIEPHMLGRIRCLRFFSLFTCISLVLFAFIDDVAAKTVIVIVCYFFMVPMYSILNTLTPEMYPTDIRTTALAFISVLIGLPSLFTPFLSAGVLSTGVLWLYPVVWGACFLMQTILTFFLHQETAGKKLDDRKVS